LSKFFYTQLFCGPFRLLHADRLPAIAATMGCVDPVAAISMNGGNSHVAKSATEKE
jgi:hypothetical protein